MDFSKKSIAALVVVVIVAGSAASLSGFDISGSLIGKEVPWWCIKAPVWHPPTETETNYPPSPVTGRGIGLDPSGSRVTSMTPDFTSGGTIRQLEKKFRFNHPLQDALKDKLKKLDSSPTADSSSGSRGGTAGSAGNGILKPGGRSGGSPGVTIPGVPGVPGGGGSKGLSEPPTPKTGYWSYKTVCPDGYWVDYQNLDDTCTRIKKLLDSGVYTEDTLPPEMKKMLPGCKRHGSWFTVPAMSDNDCEAIQAKAIVYGWDKLTGAEASKLDYCFKMKPASYNKPWKKFEDDCIEAKKTGKKLSPEMEKACGDNFGWWGTLLPTDDCKEIFKTVAAYTAAGGNVCDLPFGEKSYGCFQVYSELNTTGAKMCEKGGGG